MMKRWLTLLLILASPALVLAQATTSSKIGWDQVAPDLATAQSYTYKLSADGAPAAAIAGVTCAGTTSPFQCQVPFPAFTPTVQHTITLIASNAAGDSAPSAPFAFTFVVVPSSPSNVHLIP